jgi:DNA repair protein RecN (Recombination protein N)
VDVHGQSEHFFLLSESNQLKTLDAVIGGVLTSKKETLRDLLKTKKAIEEQIALLGGDEQERERRLDVLKFQIDEIEGADLKDGEEDDLLAKRNKINHLEKIITALREAMEALSGEGGVADGLRAANRVMSGVARLGAEYEALIGSLETIERARPVLLVSLYHRSRDIYFLPKFLESRILGYKFYLRRLRSVPAWELNLILIPT